MKEARRPIYGQQTIIVVVKNNAVAVFIRD
jgi:hypothetical protein